MEDRQKYFFDLNGYLVIEDVLTPEELATCNEAIDQNQENHVQREVRSDNWSDTLKGKGRRDLRGMLTWPAPWNQPYLDLLVHPRIVPCLIELLGDGFHLDHIYGILMDRGTEGLSLHGGGDRRFNMVSFYGFFNGQMRSGLTVVSWALTDSRPGDGGFMCIPGSHKSNFPLPRDAATMKMDLGVVLEVPLKAGSAIIFTEALSHGTLPWAADYERRSMLFKYSPGPLNHAPPANLSDAQDYLPSGIHEIWDDLTPQQQAVLEPPYHPNRPRFPL